MNIKRIPESQGWLQRLGEEAVRIHTFMPRMIDLEVSRVCNLNCTACMRRASTSLAEINKEKTDENLFCSLERFQEIHKQIPTIGTLNFMGDGEPLMNPELKDIIRYSALNNIYTVITTNATLVAPSDIRHWQKNKVYRIHVSVDAPEEKLYESMRVGADFDTTINNLKFIGSSGIPLCINMVLTKKNIHTMPNMVKLASQVGAKEITFLMPICTYGNDKDVRPDNTPENNYIFDRTARLCESLGVKWIFPLELDPTWRRFSFPFIRPEISVEGDIWACCYSLGRGKNWVFEHCIDIPEGTYNMGNMFSKGFREVWYGPEYKELRNVYKKSEIKKGTVISREDYLKLVEEVESREVKGRFDHCEICPARWGTACS